MALKDFAELVEVCDGRWWVGPRRQQIPPVRVLGRICNRTCLHYKQDHGYLVIHYFLECTRQWYCTTFHTVADLTVGGFCFELCNEVSSLERLLPVIGALVGKMGGLFANLSINKERGILSTTIGRTHNMDKKLSIMK